MTRQERAEVYRNRIEYLREKRRVFFEGNDTWVGADFAIKAYRGENRPDWWDPADPWVNINKTKSAIRAALPSLLYANPEFRIYPKCIEPNEGGQQQGITPEQLAYARAHSQQIWLNHVWECSKATLHTRIAIQNAFCSYGVIKAGYRCQFQDDKKRGVVATDDVTGEVLRDGYGDPILERGQFLMDPETGDYVRDEDGEPITHPGTICKEEWVVEAIDPKMMLFDIESGPDFFQHRFVIEEWVRPLKEVQNDPRFSRSVRERVVETESANGPASQRKSIFDRSSGNSLSPEKGAARTDEARVRGYDIYDFETNEYLVLPEGGADEGTNDEFLLVQPMPPGMRHGPYRFLKFTEDMGTEWYPIPDAIDMALVNREYNITRSQMMIHREHTKTRYLELPGAFDVQGTDAEEERSKFAHGPDGTLVRVQSAQSVLPAPKAQLDGSFGMAIPNIAADFNEVGGMPGESRGVADADTATQASILATGAEVRNNDRRDNQVQTFLREIGEVLLLSGQANAEMDSWIVEHATTQAGVAPFQMRRVSPEELKGDFDVTIALGSTMPKNDPRVLSQLITLLNAIAQNPLIGKAKGLIRRALDAMSIDPGLAEEIFQMAEGFEQSQMQANPAGGSPEQANPAAGQMLGQMLGGMGNAAGGAPTGAGLNS